MTVLHKRSLALLSLLFVLGCVSDELAVYDDGVVGKEAAKGFAGEYRVEEWPGDTRPTTIRVTHKDGELRFAYSLANEQVDARFIVSKIPGSQKELHLISIPSQRDTNQANVFLIGKADKEQTHIWVAFENLPVVKEHLKFQNGKADASDVKKFLAEHADEFVTANDPQVKLVNPSR